MLVHNFFLKCIFEIYRFIFSRKCLPKQVKQVSFHYSCNFSLLIQLIVVLDVKMADGVLDLIIAVAKVVGAEASVKTMVIFIILLLFSKVRNVFATFYDHRPRKHLKSGGGGGGGRTYHNGLHLCVPRSRNTLFPSFRVVDYVYSYERNSCYERCSSFVGVCIHVLYMLWVSISDEASLKKLVLLC